MTELAINGPDYDGVEVTPTRRTVARALRAFVARGSGLESKFVIPSRQDGPAPTAPYATVFPYLRTALASAYTLTDRTDPDAPRERTYQNAALRASVRFFRSGSLNRADRFQLWAYSPMGRLVATSHGLTFQRTTQVRDITQRVSAKWEEGAQLDLFMMHALRTAPVDMGTIENARLVIKMDDGYIDDDGEYVSDPITHSVEVDKDAPPKYT